MRIALLTLIVTFGLSASAVAQNQPIRSQQDAACRDQARDRVFGAPNPQGLSLYDLGAQIYRSCMKQSGGQSARKRTRQLR